MQGDSEWLAKLAFGLKLLKELDALTGRLNLRGKDCMNIITNEGVWYDLDGEGTDGSDHIQRSTEHAVVGEIRIEFPNGARSLHSRDFCDVTHYVDGGEINNVAKASSKMNQHANGCQ
jgi:hypothetical protein